MQKLNVGFFIDTFFPMMDGVIQVVDNLATILQEKCNITVFTIRPADKNKIDEKEHNYRVVRCKSKGLFFLDYDMPAPKLDREFRNILNQEKLDIVYFHSPMAIGKMATKYGKKYNVPILCHLHSEYKNEFRRATHSKLLAKILLDKIMRVFNKSDCAIAVNEFTAQLFKEEYGLKVPTKVVCNATHLRPVENVEEAKAEINREYQLKESDQVFAYVGRITILKNIDFILDSLKIYKEKTKDFKFIVVGSGKDSEYFKNRAKELRLEENVIFAGRIMDKNKLEKIYARADLFSFPSTYDTDGIVKVEAASQGTPTIVLENCGAASGIVDGENGFIVKREVQSFVDKIHEAMTDEKLYQKVSLGAKNTLYRTWEDSAEKVYQIMQELIKNNKKDKSE